MQVQVLVLLRVRILLCVFILLYMHRLPSSIATSMPRSFTSADAPFSNRWFPSIPRSLTLALSRARALSPSRSFALSLSRALARAQNAAVNDMLYVNRLRSLRYTLQQRSSEIWRRKLAQTLRSKRASSLLLALSCSPLPSRRNLSCHASRRDWTES